MVIHLDGNLLAGPQVLFTCRLLAVSAEGLTQSADCQGVQASSTSHRSVFLRRTEATDGSRVVLAAEQVLGELEQYEGPYIVICYAFGELDGLIQQRARLS